LFEVEYSETHFNQLINQSFVLFNSKGNELQHKMGMLTEALSPAHTYVPWVTVNGVHTEEIQAQAQDNLIKLICDTYSNAAKPVACYL